MRNELFLSYFVDRFKDTPLSGAVARTCLSATLAAPAFGVWLLFFDASAWLAAAAALTAIVLTGCAVRALRAYRVLKAQADQLQRLTRALLATNSDCLTGWGSGRASMASPRGMPCAAHWRARRPRFLARARPRRGTRSGGARRCIRSGATTARSARCCARRGTLHSRRSPSMMPCAQ